MESIRKGQRQAPVTVQIQGPFETSYSLAIVNRKLAEALDMIPELDVSIYATEGPGDYIPNHIDLADKEHAYQLWQKSKKVSYPTVTIRNMYPPRVYDANGLVNLLFFGWEETKVPEEYVAHFNRYLDGIGAMSNFVKKALTSSGVKVPIVVTGVGVELPANYEVIQPYDIKTRKSFRFLHISSAFPRKGVDILLEAYFSSFTGDDDTTLIIKTFPNPHNTVEQQLYKLRQECNNPPEVILINRELSQDHFYGLYKTASCYVHAARGEGFGLTVAEAMLAKVPVVVSPNTALADFCNEQTAVLVGYDMVRANSHLSEAGSLWAEPTVAVLAEKMREMTFACDDHKVKLRIGSAQRLISTEFSWKRVAQRWHALVEEHLSKRINEGC